MARGRGRRTVAEEGETDAVGSLGTVGRDAGAQQVRGNGPKAASAGGTGGLSAVPGATLPSGSAEGAAPLGGASGTAEGPAPVSGAPGPGTAPSVVAPRSFESERPQPPRPVGPAAPAATAVVPPERATAGAATSAATAVSAPVGKVVAAGSSSANSAASNANGNGDMRRFRRITYTADVDLAVVRQVLLNMPWRQEHGRVMDAWDRTATEIARGTELEESQFNGHKLQDRVRILCDEYKRKRAASARASGIDEPPPTELDTALEDLVEELDQHRKDRTGRKTQQADEEQLAKDIRENALQTLAGKRRVSPETVDADDLDDTSGSSTPAGPQSKMRAVDALNQVANAISRRQGPSQAELEVRRDELVHQRELLEYQRQKDRDTLAYQREKDAELLLFQREKEVHAREAELHRIASSERRLETILKSGIDMLRIYLDLQTGRAGSNTSVAGADTVPDRAAPQGSTASNRSASSPAQPGPSFS